MRQQAEILSIELDSTYIEVRLSQNKLNKIRILIKKALIKNSISLQNLQSVTDFLLFITKVVITD